MKDLFGLLFVSAVMYAADEVTEIPQSEDIVAIESVEPSLFTNPPALLENSAAPPIPELPHKSSFLTVGLSWLVPGLGSAYLGDYKAAAGVFGSYAAGVSLEVVNAQNPQYWSSLAVGQNAWFYGVYAAYRDVRLYNIGDRYSYKMPTDSFNDLSLAPFRWRVLKKPEVWGGFLGIFSLAAVSSYFGYHDTAFIQADSSSKTKDAAARLNPLCAFPVGLSEEAFFRGYLQSFLSERFTPAGGMVLSSLAFGAIHVGNAAVFMEPEDQWRYYAFTLPLITSMGGYFSLLTYKNNSLQESVALHTWYDFTLMSLATLATQSASVGKPRFAISFAF